MYLYKKNKDKSIIVFSFTPNKEELIKFKKKYLEDIKSVILHISNQNTQNLLLNNSKIMFNALDREENDGNISYIKETNNSKIISKYINGEFDHLVPLCIIGNVPSRKSSYSGELNNCDSSLLFTGGHYHNHEFITDEGILLTGWLDNFQPLLSGNIDNINYFNYTNEVVYEFLKIFSCTEECIINLDDLMLMQKNNLLQINSNIEDVFEKSEDILNNYSKVKKLK